MNTTARHLLNQISTLVNRALGNLHQACQTGNQIDSEQLDQYQLAAFDLAYSAAELRAADIMLRYSEDQGPLEQSEALFFTAEALANIRRRLLDRCKDTGLSSDILIASAFSPEWNDFIATCSGSAYTEALFQHLLTAHDRQPGFTGNKALPEDKQLTVDTFHRMTENLIKPQAESIHRNDSDIPDTILDPLIESGCLGLSIPERFGGLQPDDHPDTLGMIVVTEELSRGSLCAAGSLITRPEIVARALLAGGTEAQKHHWLPGIAKGNPLAAIAVTEPDYGSDVAQLRLKATPVEGGWVLNGSKTWCTMAGNAGVLLTLARTHPDLSLGHKGLSLFLVEKPADQGHQFQHTQPSGGSITGRAIPTIGYRGMHSFDIAFRDYFVPAENLVGEQSGIGKGFYYQMAGFSGGRLQTAARATGVMQSAYEQAMQYGLDRKVFGKAVAEYGLTRFKLARIATLINTCRQFTYQVAREMDEQEDSLSASLVKLFACKSAEWVTREAMQIHGGMGYAEESAVSRYFVDARVLSIFEGTEETLALKVIARSLITAGKLPFVVAEA